MKNLLTIAAMSLCLTAHADEWTKVEIAKEAAVVGLFAIDYAQTRSIENTKGLYETNKFLGEHPSPNRIRNYFVGTTIIHFVVADALSTKYRNYFLDGTITFEVVVTAHNKSIGMSIKY